MNSTDEVKPYSATYRKFIPIALLAAGAVGITLLIINANLAMKAPARPYQDLYAKIASISPLHQQVLGVYTECRGLRGTWSQKFDVIAHDCLTTTMRKMDKLNLPRAELFGIEQDIRKGEWELSERIINTP